MIRAMILFLVLSMRKFSLFLLSFLMIACHENGDSSHNVLSQPPFDTLTDSIHHAPQDPQLYFRRATLLYQNDQGILAEQDLRKAWQLSPREDYALFLTTLLKNRNADTAIQFLEEAVKKLPQSLPLQIGLARGYQKKGALDKALGITEGIIRQDPAQMDALVLQSEIMAEQQNKNGSRTYLERAHALVPSDPALAYDLAYEYADEKNVRALMLADSLLKAHAPEAEKAYYVKGLYFMNTGNAPLALKNFDNAMAANYNFLDAYRDKGQVLLDQKKYEEALKTFALALKVAPANAEFYYLSGLAQKAMGRKDEAKLNFQRAYGLDHSMTEAKEAADQR